VTTPSATLIRPASTADLPAIAAIYAHHVRHGTASFELAPPGLEEMRRRQDALAQSGHPYLVAERAGEVLGYAYAGPYRPRPGYANTVEDSIYLHPHAAGQGLGSLLLTALLKECTRRGFRQMVAAVGDSANAASIGLHRKHGFQLVGTLRAVGYKHGRWLDSVFLQRDLGEGDATPPLRSAA
jgi:L-amino acid N-acyltransferase YncA